MEREIHSERLRNEIELLLSDHKEILGAALVGGYGRGEGAIYNEGGRCKLYNDIDIVIVSEQRHLNVIEAIIPHLTGKIVADFGVKDVDFDLIPLNQLGRRRLSIYNYDLKYGSTILKGGKFFEAIPYYDAKKIGSKEIYTLFITRLFCLISSEFQQGNIESQRFAYYQLSKACLAVCDVILLKYKKYHVSYKERVSRLEKLSFISSVELDYIQWALKFKLNPSEENFWNGDPELFRQEISKMYLTVMFHCLGQYFLFKPSNVSTLSNAIMLKPYELSKVVLSLASSSKKYYRRYLLVMAQANLAESIAYGHRVPDKALSYLAKLPRTKLDSEESILQSIYNSRRIYY